MVGTALVNNLKNIRDGKNRTRPAIHIDEIYEYDRNSTLEELDEYCYKADFVFNLAGVNRPDNIEDFIKGNFGFASKLLDKLKNIIILALLCFLLLFRLPLPAVLETVNMEGVRRQEKNFSFPMEKKQEPKWQYTVFPTSWGTVVQNITVP